jgi:hypothetical protein
MRKLFLLLSLAIFATFSFGQQKFLKAGTGGRMKPNSVTGNQIQAINTDSLNMYYKRATNYVVIPSSPAGFVFGTSYYQDTLSHLHPAVDATGCHFDSIGVATVTDVLLWAGDKKIAFNADSITVKIYNVSNADTLPTTTLDSVRISTADLDTTQGYAFFTDVPVNANITSSILVAVEYPGINDTISFWSSNPDTSLHHGKGDGLGQKRARQRMIVDLGLGLGWKPVDDIYGGTMDADVMFIPVVQIANGVNEFKNELFTLKPVSPVPSTGLVSLEYTLSTATNVSYRVMDGSGRIIIKSDSELKPAASYKETLNLSSYSAGKYYITFNAGTKTLTQKMMIVK